MMEPLYFLCILIYRMRNYNQHVYKAIGIAIEDWQPLEEVAVSVYQYYIIVII